MLHWERAKDEPTLFRRLAGLSQPILDIAYSPDGRFLAVGLAKGQGVRIYSAEDYSVVQEDFQYGGSVYSLDFDRTGRLVTVSDDGTIRLYSPDFRLIAKKQTSHKAPFSVSFSHDGSLIAVGYMDAPKVEVFSGDDLTVLYAPSTKGVTNGNLSSVAWLSDGNRLCAAGRWSLPDGTNPIRCWDDRGKGASHNIPTKSRDTIISLKGLPNGQLAFASGDPAIGVVGKGGTIQFYHPPVNAEFRDHLENLLVNDDGSDVVFSFSWNNTTMKGLFSISERYLEINPKEFDGFNAPIVKGLPLDNWKGSEKPTLAKKPLSLDPYERSYAAAITPDLQGVVLGGEWSLRFFDRAGNQKWKVTTPSAVRAVNVTKDRRLVVAACADGTIRWHRLRDGARILSLFILPQHEQWVVWSPSGYYDASVGADGIIGWHIHRGEDREPDFFPIARFRTTLYRPDLPVALVKTLDEKEALRYAAKEWGRSEREVKPEEMLPPVVRLLNPPPDYQTDKREVTLKFSLRSSREAPVKTVKVLVDGRPVKVEEGEWAAGEETVREVTVSLPPQDATVSVLALNRFAASEPASTRILLARARAVDTKTPVEQEPKPPSGFVAKPKLYVLAVGVGKYPKEEMRLLYPAKDAQDFARTMEQQRGGLYREVEARILVDDQATREKILEGFDWIRKETTANDVAMIFLAGHGLTDNRSGTYYYMPVDADPEKLMGTGIPAHYLQDTVASLEGKVLLFVDACYSANILKGQKTRGLPAAVTSDLVGLVNDLTKAENGAVLFASSSRTQQSLEREEWQNGAFTKALLEGLSGGEDYEKQGKITVNMLNLYISETVKKLTRGDQTPIMSKPAEMGDFPVAVVGKT